MSKKVKAQGVIKVNGVESGEVQTFPIKDYKKRGGAGRGQGRKRVEDRKRQVRVSLKGSRIDLLGGDRVLSGKLEGIVEDMYQNKSKTI